MSDHFGFTALFIKRPVLSVVISLFFILLGSISYIKLTIREFPEIHPTAVTIRTVFPGADAKLMENFVTTPIEKSIAGVEGVDTLSSTSSQNTSLITINFQLGYDLNVAINDINGRISSIRWQLPKDINDPIVEKNDPNAQPTLYIGFFSQVLSTPSITEYLIKTVQPQIETLPGVGEARLFGEREYAMRIWLNPKKLAAHHVTLNEVKQALERNNVRLPAGTIDSHHQTFNVSFFGDLETAQSFNDLIVSVQGHQVIRIKDIGYAQLGVRDDNFSVNIAGKEGVVMGVIPKINANPLSVARYVRSTLEKIKSFLPQGLSLQTLWDSSIFIERSIQEVKKTLFETAFFVILVMFLFFGSFRVLLIPSVVIPISLTGAFALMWLMGFTINTLTLLAMVLAIGMVVDDAIVVIENIYRHVESGTSLMKSALIGAKEIRLAIISMTFTLAAVYAPIGFTTGLSGALFKEFAFSLAGAVIISGIVALTLSPMMCTKALSLEVLNKKLPRRIYELFSKLSHRYNQLLSYILHRLRWVMIGTGVLSLILVYTLFTTMPKELGPVEDMGLVLSIINGPASANLKFTEKNTQKLAKIFDQVPEKLSYAIINGYPNGTHSAIAFLVLKPWEIRQRSTNQVIYSLMGPMLGLPGVLAFPINPYSLPGQVGTMPIELVLKSSLPHPELYETSQALMFAMQKIPFLANLDTSLKFDRPEFDISIHRNLARTLGLSMDNIGSTLNLALGEPLFNRFVMNNRSYYVIPQLDHLYREVPASINELYMRTLSGQLIPLSDIVTIKEVTRARNLPHFQQMNSATLTASTFPPGLPISIALDEVNQIAKKILPKNITYEFAGKTREFIKNKGKMLDILIYALLFIYLTLAAQFESFRDPFIIITTVPLSTLGALIALRLTGGTLNVYTNIGLVTLIGLISKHGILMVEFANQLRKQGMDKLEAILQSATLRLRPILMTTLSMILGAFPLALASGAGAISRQQIGWTIVGGMSIGTLFSLLIVPAFYLLLAKKEVAVEK